MGLSIWRIRGVSSIEAYIDMVDDREEVLRGFRGHLRHLKILAAASAGLSIGTLMRYFASRHIEGLLTATLGLTVCAFCLSRVCAGQKWLRILAALEVKIEDLEAGRTT